MMNRSTKIAIILTIIFIALLVALFVMLPSDIKSPITVPTSGELTHAISGKTAHPAQGVGNLPSAKESHQPFDQKKWFGFSDEDTLLIAVHEKTLRILSQAKNLNPKVLQLALRSYACAHQQDIGRPRYLTIIDYSLPSTSKRMWVIDLQEAKVNFNTLVAHGKNSGYVNTTQFSDVPESKQTSIGLFQTASTYIGHNGYSLKLKGLEPGVNQHAESREVVIHGAMYVSEDFVKKYHYLGRSWGCPALSKLVSTPIINEIKGGTLVFAYYPAPTWLNNSIYIHCKAPLPWEW